MSKYYLRGTPSDLVEEIELDGVRMTETVGQVRCIQGTPKSGGSPIIWLEITESNSSRSYKWTGSNSDFNDSIELDPDSESRWELQ